MSDNKPYVNPRWLEEGMAVWVPWVLVCAPEERKAAIEHRRALKCTLTVAAGDAGRAENTFRKVSRWFRLEQLYVPPDDPHA